MQCIIMEKHVSWRRFVMRRYLQKIELERNCLFELKYDIYSEYHDQHEYKADIGIETNP